MADISDVEQAVVDLIDSIIYPNGDGLPSIIFSPVDEDHPTPVNQIVQTYRGWPKPTNLDADMSLGENTVDISIYRLPMGQNSTRYIGDNIENVVTPPPTITVEAGFGFLALDDGSGDFALDDGSGRIALDPPPMINKLPNNNFLLDDGTGKIALDDGSGNLILDTLPGLNFTLFGTPFSPQNIIAIIDNASYGYAIQPGDTLATIATNLAAAINVGHPAVANESTITIAYAAHVQFRVGVVATYTQEIERETCMISISIWTNTPELRDIVAKAIGPTLRNIKFLALVNDEFGRFIYQRSPPFDKGQNENVYRRDFVYSVEFPTTLNLTAPTITVLSVNLTELQITHAVTI